jgi:hypothetical protein
MTDIDPCRLPPLTVPGQTGAMNDRMTAQLRIIKAVVNTLDAAGISADAGRSKAVLTGAGATALATQPPEESCEFTWDGADFSTAYFDRQPDGSSIQLLGRWSDWLFPPGSFGDEPGTLDGMPVLAMSVAGMLAMKEQYPRLRNGQFSLNLSDRGATDLRSDTLLRSCRRAPSLIESVGFRVRGPGGCQAG